MSLLAWNCRGLGKPRTIQFLKHITQQKRPSIIFLSETLAREKKVAEVCKTLNFAGFISIEVQGHSGGLALLWKNEGGCTVIEATRNYIDFEVENEGVGRWRYTGFYGCPERQRRRESWGMLLNLRERSNLPWCVIGDFNDMIYEDEKRGGNKQPFYLLTGFTETLETCQLKDLGFVGEKFTWERSRGSNFWIQERLDRGVANQKWRELFPEAEVEVIEVATSDHLPLYLQLNRRVYMPKEKKFRFENIWVREKECRNIVKHGWEAGETRDIVHKIKSCGEKLQEWGEKLRSRRDTQGINRYNEVRDEYLKLLDRQEVYWKQRAKQHWLREGDKNTKFFHRYASNRRKNNRIDRLKDGDGNWQDTPEGIRNIIESYFVDLFQASCVDGRLSEHEVVKQVSTYENEELMREISVEEVKTAVFSMHPDKASGPDGFNPAFYQVYWDIVHVELVDFCRTFLQTGELPAGVNNTCVCLIPKVKKPKTMGDLRPISLCNVLVRILSKIMANRLKKILESIISDRQSAFIEGRLLTDNALIAFEINHYMQRKRQGRTGVAGLKLDISKAYDRLEWSFVRNMMVKFGFNSVWIERIMQFISSVAYSFLHNGDEFGCVVPRRGLRQGDPISPYLYIMCAEGLSAIIRRNEEAGLIHGCRIARGAPSISHLLFADDCYMFFKAAKGESSTLKGILQRYARISGQVINSNKSSITFSTNTSAEDRQEVQNQLQVQQNETPGKYLGLPMKVGQNKKAEFEFLVEKVASKLQTWGMGNVSKAGKVTLLKSATQTIPTFWMNLMLIPQDVCDRIEKKMNQYWWGGRGEHGGIRWMCWDHLCEVKEVGGLGFRKLREFNVAMLAKQAWRLVNNTNPLVAEIMKARYYAKSDFLNATLGSNPSFMWRSIMESQEVIKRGCRRKIGDGKDTNLWTSPWLPCLENGFLTSTAYTGLHDATVDGLMMEGQKRWDVEVLNDICNERDRQLIQQIHVPSRGIKDSWYWLLDEKGEFSVKSCYRHLRGERESQDKGFWKKLWGLNLPGKIVNFLWRVCRDVLPTAIVKEGSKYFANMFMVSFAYGDCSAYSVLVLFCSGSMEFGGIAGPGKRRRGHDGVASDQASIPAGQ
ncbi:uncharacterized protein LOC141665954 [Apium graveolens]|uniref:uncharacterized protein LOC141665954 n=1 Tax=Apium graveolens TaxID=4045 RepID=UPI003D79C2F7